jgi:epoxyqueuosine reductase
MPRSTSEDPGDPRTAIRARAAALGFEACGFADAGSVTLAGERLRVFVADGHHAGMSWMEETLERRADPRVLWPDARSAIMLGLNYGPGLDLLRVLQEKSNAAISVYAQGRDYHDVIKGRLKTLAGFVHRLTGAGVKVFVDTAPLMEKPLAEAAGIGWQGKHTNLVSRDFGSWLFLGAILTAAEFAPGDPHDDHCGACRACLDICPTQAFPAPYRLDARRCISYLTIEHKGTIAREFRAAMGNRIYGCDDCLAACPWNKFAQEAREAKLKARGTGAPALAELLSLSDAAFRTRFAGSPVKRVGRDRFLRNVLIAAGNSADASLVPQVEALLADGAPVVRAMAVWALDRLAPERAISAKGGRLAGEADPGVRAEWGAVQGLPERAPSGRGGGPGRGMAGS